MEQGQGIADEAHFNEFVVEVQGELITPLIRREGVKNADYLFREAQVVYLLTPYEARAGSLGLAMTCRMASRAVLPWSLPVAITEIVAA